jgi:hypothetical protein
MPTIHTLGHPSTRTEFTYSGSVKEGVTLHFDKANKFISSDFFRAILKCFKGSSIPGGFSMTDPTPTGLGIWVEYYSEQINPVRLYSRHASFIAAILKYEGCVTSSLQGNAVMLHFHNDYEL